MSDLDRLKKSFGRLLAPLLFRLDYTRHYPATVVAQNADGSLELASDVPPIASLSKVAVAYGVPGISAVIASGGKVTVGFVGADPALPYVLVHDQASVTSLALLGGTKPVARLGDGVNVNLPPTATFAGTITTGSGPAPFAGPAALTRPFVGVLASGQLGAQA
jgi:hypothetical protein